MIGRRFVDTNVILYAASPTAAEGGKHARALALLDETEFCISAQVLQEFYVNVIRKGRGPAKESRARQWLDRLSLCLKVPIDLALVEAAIQNAQRYQISYWDAAIVAAAEFAGADILYTEDLNHGQRYGTVLVQNPFRDL